MEETVKHELKAINSNNAYQSLWLQIGLLVVVCIILGLLDGFRSYTSTFHDGTFHGSFYGIMRWDVIGWMIWIAFIPFILWLCKSFPINQNTWQESLVIFIPIGILLAVIRALFPAFMHILFFEGFADLQRWLPNKFYILIADFMIGFSFYMLVLTFGQAKNYYKQYRGEELRATQLEAQLSKAQLKALKMQLHPHFLFNALNSISALQIEDSEAAQEMTARLGDFLRMTLENIGTQEITLEREIEFLRCYLDIEKVRLGKRLSTNIEISPQTRFCKVPNLILQPLVENAIKHGISKQKENGQINIKTTQENDWLKLEIKDNGKGIGNRNKKEIFTKGLGLSNAKARLQKLYGSDFRFEIGNLKENEGLQITLCIPYKLSERQRKEILN